MISGILWHGIGLACLYGIIRILPSLYRELRGRAWTFIFVMSCIGLIVGIAGVMLSVLFMLGMDTVIHISPTTGLKLNVRAILTSVLFVFGGYSAGRTADRLLYGRSHLGIVTRISIIVALVMIMQPIAYGWGLKVWSLVSG